MSRIEVLIAAMNQTDDSLYGKLRLQTDAVIANQTDSCWYKEYERDGNVVKVVSTAGRGVGRNRNIALLNASADICILGDQDLLYAEDYPSMVDEAFRQLPDADVIIFHIVNLKNPSKRIITGVKRVGYFNFARYGTCRMAFRRESLLKANIWFSLLYGGGARYSSGEDTLFLGEAYRKGLKIYTHPGKIADAVQESSTWFNGYDEKYFFDKGVLLANLFPRMKYAVGLKMAFRFRKESAFSLLTVIRLIFSGIKEFKKTGDRNSFSARRRFSANINSGA